MTGIGTNSRVAFLNQLLGESSSWSSPRALLADLCTTHGLRSAGFRWPAEGSAVLLAETQPSSPQTHRYPIPVNDLGPGLFWADGPLDDPDQLRLVANALGHSRAFHLFLGPLADQARIARRLDDAARVAGRVAHDLDNVFQGVTGFAALALESLPRGSAAYANIIEVENSANHGLKFCQQLHQLSRGGIARPLPATVPMAVQREIDRLVKTHPGLKFETHLDSGLPAVAMEGGGLQSLLGMLLDNAAEASPKGGTVRLTARLVELGAADLGCFLGLPAAGPHVEIQIQDSGPGLTDEARRKMFVEPFFTTKFRHRGLSLAVVYRMLHAHRGGVQANSSAGTGTTIRVVLPLSAARVPAFDPGRSTGGPSR